MQPRCKKCGRPLNDPNSIARGMGPECAGIAGNRRKLPRAGNKNRSGFTYNLFSTDHTAAPLFACIGDNHSQERVPQQLARFPSDLLDLVLSAPAGCAISGRVRSHRRGKSKQKDPAPIITVKEIRRICISLRLLFWPGFSYKGEPLACIPSGDDNWRIGKDGREISASDLVSYLSKYGVI